MPIPTNFVNNTGMHADADYLNQLGADVNANTAAVAALTTLLGIATATVATSQPLTSITYTDLATTTDAVTATIGASGKALVLVSAKIAYTSGSSNTPYLGFAVTGATTLAASDSRAGRVHVVGTEPATTSNIQLLTELNPGSTTFKMKYRLASAGGYNIYDRNITVIPWP